MLTSFFPNRHGDVTHTFYPRPMGKVLQLRPERRSDDSRFVRCRSCREAMSPSDWHQGFRRGLRLNAASSLTVNEFLCPVCFEQLAAEERDEWIKVEELGEF